MSLIISIDGNIGSGKSTFVENLRKTFAEKNGEDDEYKNNVIFLQEPVDEWQSLTDHDGKNILHKYYENQEKYAFAFQMTAYISRIALLKKTVKENPKAIIVTERSVFSDKFIFAKMLYDDGKLNKIEYDIYKKWFDTFLEDLPVHNFIYLRTIPEVAYERMHRRGRPCEENVPLSYIFKCHDYHENMFSTVKAHFTIPIDTYDIHSNSIYYKSAVDVIYAFINGLLVN